MSSPKETSNTSQITTETVLQDNVNSLDALINITPEQAAYLEAKAKRDDYWSQQESSAGQLDLPLN